MFVRNFILTILVLVCGTSHSQRLNRYDKKGQRQGRWVVYLDSAKTLKSIEGRYKHGNAVGKFHYYNMQGQLERKEITRFKILRTTMYYPDGTIRLKGKARIENLTDKIHYYFYGKWLYYDKQGKLLKYCYYEKGILVRTEYVDKNNKTNDSLINALNAMDKYFNEVNADLLDSIATTGFNPQKRERLQLELYMRDTLSFKKVEFIFAHYGYPSVDRTHEAAIIPFYILSYAPTYLKEKHLPLLKQAADKKDLDWKPLAFFIDKIKVAKGEKQIYGTQYYFSKRQQVFYPIEDPDNLAKRRAEVGLVD